MPKAKKNVAFGTARRCVNNDGLWEKHKLIAYDFEKIPQKRREMREIPLFDGIFSKYLQIFEFLV